MPVCITGMHRSGTSMVANLLRLAGLYLGPDDELAPPAPDNPEGFWENVRFVALNDALLNEFGGAWDCPPLFPDGWDLSNQLNDIRDEARTLADRFPDSVEWGWKDPRNSLTMSFWRTLCPTIKAVLCVRNPLEVAGSLKRRQGFSPQLSMSLWYRYNSDILRTMPADRLIVTHNSSYFRSAHTELERVLRFLEMPYSEHEIAESCTAISTTLRHHEYTIEDLVAAGIAPLILNLYRDLMNRAEFREDPPHSHVPAHLIGNEGKAIEADRQDALLAQQPALVSVNGIGKIATRELEALTARNELLTVRQDLAERDATIEKLYADLVRQGEYIHELEAASLAAQEEIRKQGEYVSELETRLHAMNDTLNEQGTYVRTLETNLEEAYTELRTQGEYVRKLEADLNEAFTLMRQQGEYVQTLERSNQDLGKDLAAQGEYVRTLEAERRIGGEAT